MLSKTYKLNGFETYQLVKSKNKLEFPFFDIYWQSKADPKFKAGLVIAKKLKLKAHKRNKLKRKVFNALRLIIEKNKPNFFLLIYINNIKTINLSVPQIEKEINKGLKILNKLT